MVDYNVKFLLDTEDISIILLSKNLTGFLSLSLYIPIARVKSVVKLYARVLSIFSPKCMPDQFECMPTLHKSPNLCRKSVQSASKLAPAYFAVVGKHFAKLA